MYNHTTMYYAAIKKNERSLWADVEWLPVYVLEGKNESQKSTCAIYGMLPFVQETKENKYIFKMLKLYNL